MILGSKLAAGNAGSKEDVSPVGLLADTSEKSILGWKLAAGNSGSNADKVADCADSSAKITVG